MVRLQRGAGVWVLTQQAAEVVEELRPKVGAKLRSEGEVGVSQVR